MRTKLLYVLVSTETDIYLEQAYISMLSARHHMPDVHITLVMDQITENSLQGQRTKILDLVGEICVKELPQNLSGQNRSRILKTSCRNLVSGDFLFIDCDTIILKPLTPIDSIQHELCACRDSHSNFPDNPYRKMCISHCKKLGCEIKDEDSYFNSGVILAKDTPKVREFYLKWNANWIAGKEQGVIMDQPAFELTNLQFHRYITPLPDIWNCQVIHGIKYLKDAYILHYLCTSKTKPGDKQMFILRDKYQFTTLKKELEVSETIRRCFEDPFYGIADCVHVLSGKNLQVCQSNTFKFLETEYGSRPYRAIERIFKTINLLKKGVNKLKNNEKL